MSKCVQVPIIEHDGYRWGALANFGKDHEITCEATKLLEDKYSFKGGHRVRIYRLKKQVYWKLPSVAVEIDISGVAPRRVQGSVRS
jgi:hypothetical protein